MKNIKILILIFITLFLEGCFSIPGYVNSDGFITPPYQKNLFIESVKGSVTISPVETTKGTANINPIKSDTLKTKKQSTIYLSEGSNYFFNIEGNHSLVLGIRTLDEEAIVRITYKKETTEYIIHNSDFMDKLVYIENY